MPDYPLSISLRSENPNFLDLRWDLPLSNWTGIVPNLEEVPKGLTRHPVVFINYSGDLFALKEMPPDLAGDEFERLLRVEELHLPVVSPVGHVLTRTAQGKFSVLITRYLERSLPYRMLFMRSSLERYREHLLDAISGLLVQLHLAGVFWGDCSLSNTLFRRDAGKLQAYLVDAETMEIHPGHLLPALRFQDLQIMEENINAEIGDLRASGLLYGRVPGAPSEALADIGGYIRLRYQLLWEEITHEDIINPGEHFRIQERIRALNDLGFSVGEVELVGKDGAGQLRLRIAVTDRNFHRDQLQGLTGLDAEEMQARKMMNEILELKATLSQTQNQSVPISVAAYYWLNHMYQPTLDQLKLIIDDHTDLAELYCQVLEHKWFLSEEAQRDVGHQVAAEDYLRRFGSN
jgi:hypothetical protein